MKKILWLSQHRPIEIQIAALKEMFGADTQITQDPKPFSSAEEIARRYKSGGYDEMVIVAPLSVIAKLTELGIRPLWCQMDQLTSDRGADISYRGRHYKFNRFRHIKSVRIEFED